MIIKYILLIFLLAYSSINLNAQDTIKIEDIFKKKESTTKKSSTVKKSNQKEKIIDEFAKILDEYVYYIESEYCLKSGKNTFGKNGNSSFGSKTGMGICIGEEIWTDAMLKNPWNHDEEYNEVKDEYKAVYSLLKIQNINKNECINYKAENYRFEDSSANYTRLKVKKFKGNAFPISQKFIPNGMLVLYYKNQDDSLMSFDKQVFLATPDWDDMFGFISELNNKGLIGGFFLNYEMVGPSINFSLAGIVSSFQDENTEVKKIVPINKPPKKAIQENKNEELNKQKTKKSKPKITEIKDKN